MRCDKVREEIKSPREEIKSAREEIKSAREGLTASCTDSLASAKKADKI